MGPILRLVTSKWTMPNKFCLFVNLHFYYCYFGPFKEMASQILVPCLKEGDTNAQEISLCNAFVQHT